MSFPSKRSRAIGLSFAVLIGAVGCHQDPQRTARIYSESPTTGQIVVAMPENSKGYLKLADRLAKEKLGKNYRFVNGEEVTKEDVKTIQKRGGIKNKGPIVENVHRTEYHATFKRTGNSESPTDQGVR